MTDLIITAVGDATLREARPALNDGAGDWVRVDATTSARMRGLLLPEIPDILGRDVTSAILVGRVGPGHVAQTYTHTPYESKRTPGRATWTNEPAVISGAGVTTAVGALPDKGIVSLDLGAMLQAVADGTREWFGIQLKTSSTAAGQRFYSTESGEPAWELLLSLSDIPDAPTELRPDGGGAVEDGEPIVAWTRDDLGGAAGDQVEARIQVDTPAAGVAPDEVAPDHDSGWHARSDPEYDLAAATYTPPASPPGPTYWRVATDRNPDGSPIWSDWASFTWLSLGTLVVDSPTGPFGDPTPRILAHLTGRTLASWKAWITGPDRADVRAESGLSTGAIDWQVPFRSADGKSVLRSGDQQWLYIKAVDTEDRTVAVGQKAFVDEWIPIQLSANGALTGVTNLQVTQLTPEDPRHLWTWQRTEAATGWIIEIDDKEIERLEPEDVTLNAGVYSWEDYGQISPLRPHKLRVRALEGEETTDGASLNNRTYNMRGVWLLPPDGDPVKLAGTVVGGFSRADRVATYVPLQGPEIDIIYDTPPRTGTFEGTIDRNQDVWGAIAEINRLRASKTRKARLVWGSDSILVRLRDPDALPHEEINEANLLHYVRFGFVQIGD